MTPGKKSPKKTPKGKSPAESEQMEITVTSSERKTAVAATKKAVTPQSTSNGSEKKSDSKKMKSLKRKLDDDDYEEKTEDVKNSEAVISEDDLNASQKESSKKQKKKKQKVDNKDENKPSADLTSGDEKMDEEGGAIPSKCKLFVTGLGLEGMSKTELKEVFKSHGYNLVLTIKQNKSRHAFVGFATEEEAKKAKESVDKADCRGFPLSIDSKDVMLSALKVIKPKPARLINKDGTADCVLYVSPITPEITKQQLLASFVGVLDVYRKGKKKNWARLVCANSTVARELHKSHQGKVVEGTALRLETVEEFRKRISEEEARMVKQLQKQKKLEKKQKQTKKQEKKSKPKPEVSSDNKSDESASGEENVDDDDDDDDDVKVVNDDDDSEEEELPPKIKKAKVAGKR